MGRSREALAIRPDRPDAGARRRFGREFGAELLAELNRDDPASPSEIASHAARAVRSVADRARAAR